MGCLNSPNQRLEYVIHCLIDWASQAGCAADGMRGLENPENWSANIFSCIPCVPFAAKFGKISRDSNACRASDPLLSTLVAHRSRRFRFRLFGVLETGFRIKHEPRHTLSAGQILQDPSGSACSGQRYEVIWSG